MVESTLNQIIRGMDNDSYYAFGLGNGKEFIGKINSCAEDYFISQLQEGRLMKIRFNSVDYIYVPDLILC